MYQGLQGSNHPLKLIVLNRRETAPTVGKRSVSRQSYWVHKPWTPGTRSLQLQFQIQPTVPRVTCKDKIDDRIKAESNLQRDLSAPAATECWKDHKVVLQHLRGLCANEMSLLNCSNFSLSFESSPSKRAHFLGSLSPFMLKLATFRVILSHLLILRATIVRKFSRVRMPTAFLRDPEPSSVETQPSLDTPVTSKGYCIFRDL